MIIILVVFLTNGKDIGLDILPLLAVFVPGFRSQEGAGSPSWRSCARCAGCPPSDPPMTEAEIHRDSAPMCQRTFLLLKFLSYAPCGTISQAFAAYSKSRVSGGGEGDTDRE